MPIFVSKAATPSKIISWTSATPFTTRIVLEALNSFYCGDSVRMTVGHKTFEGEADTQPAHAWIRSVT